MNTQQCYRSFLQTPKPLSCPYTTHLPRPTSCSLYFHCPQEKQLRHPGSKIPLGCIQTFPGTVMLLWICLGIFAASPLRDTYPSYDKDPLDHSRSPARAQCWDLCLPRGWERLAWGWRAASPGRYHPDTISSLPQGDLGPTPAAGRRDVTAKAGWLYTLVAARSCRPPGPPPTSTASASRDCGQQQEEHFQLVLVKEWREQPPNRSPWKDRLLQVPADSAFLLLSPPERSAAW